MQHDSSKSEEPTKGNGQMLVVPGRSLERAKRMEARRKKIAALLKDGKSVSEISRRIKVNDATVYSDVRVLKGLPAYGAGKSRQSKGSHATMAKAAQGRVPMHIYTAARKLRDAVRTRLRTTGEITDVEMYATVLVRELIGE